MEMGEMCRTCGQQCCRKTEEFGKIALSERDYKRIRENVSQNNFAERIDSENGWIYLMKIEENNCIFLEADGKCSINSFNPLDCKIYSMLFQYINGENTFFVSARCPYHQEGNS